MRNPLNLALVLIPVALIGRFLGWPDTLVFAASGLAIVPLAKWMGTSTEHLAVRLGPGIGGLLNATFGNAAELIIAYFALQAGLINVVMASITGSIIGNILFVLGLAALWGGWGRDCQQFNRTAAGANSTMLALAVIGLVMPATFDLTVQERTRSLTQTLSVEIALVLLAAYALYLLFSLRTHRHVYGAGEETEEELHGPSWSIGRSVLVLLVATVGVALMSETLVHVLENVTHTLGWTEMFVGVILIPVIGNAAEHLTAVTVARKGQMDLSLGIAVGSSLQIALFVAPVLVLLGALLGQPMTLRFNTFEVVAVALTVLIVNFVSLDGETNWFEGAQLLAAYGVLAIAFFFHD